MALVIFFSSFLLFLIIKIPLAFSMGLSSILYFLYRGDISPLVLIQKIFSGTDNFSMLALPLFIFAGAVMNIGGIAKRLINVSTYMVGHIPGGLAMVNVLVSMFFGGISGSAVADTSAIGSVLIPEMIKKGYDRGFSAAVTAASASIGIIIPPSIPMILYGVVSGASIGKLFIAGIIPGILLTITEMIISYFISLKRNYPVETYFNLKKLIISIKEALWALIMPLFILGSIMFGIATPTETAGLSVVYGFLVSKLIYRSIRWKELWEITYESVVTTCSIMIIIGFSALVGWILSYEKIPIRIAQIILSISANKWVLLFIIDVFLIILGTFLHGTPIILVVIPILLPLVEKIGIDVIHFGMIVTFAIGIGQQTPPVGTCLFVTSALSGLDILEVAKANIPFILLLIVLLFLITYVPEISLILPKLLGI